MSVTLLAQAVEVAAVAEMTAMTRGCLAAVVVALTLAVTIVMAVAALAVMTATAVAALAVTIAMRTALLAAAEVVVAALKAGALLLPLPRSTMVNSAATTAALSLLCPLPRSICFVCSRALRSSHVFSSCPRMTNKDGKR